MNAKCIRFDKYKIILVPIFLKQMWYLRKIFYNCLIYFYPTNIWNKELLFILAKISNGILNLTATLIV